jgi:hypothetical protein
MGILVNKDFIGVRGMISLDKSHDPRNNAKMLAQITGIQLDIKQAVNETEVLFAQRLNEAAAPIASKKPSQPSPF